jgi:hypothetical protein
MVIELPFAARVRGQGDSSSKGITLTGDASVGTMSRQAKTSEMKPVWTRLIPEKAAVGAHGGSASGRMKKTTVGKQKNFTN